jgi:hypothetical protein
VQESVVPDWYDNPPESTPDMLYVTGSGESANFEFSRDKARLSAARMLCHQLNGEINSMTKQFQQEVGKRFIEKTQTVTKKVCTDTNLTGYTQAKITTVKSDGQFQTFVMLKYPVGKNNFLLEEQLSQRVQRDSAMAERQAYIDLEKERQDKRAYEAQQSRRVQEVIAPDTVKREVEVEPKPPAVRGPDSVNTSEGELKLLNVDNTEYKQRRDEALAKPGAVIGQSTVR